MDNDQHINLMMNFNYEDKSTIGAQLNRFGIFRFITHMKKVNEFNERLGLLNLV